MAKHACDVLVLLFCGTLGESSPELLGSDESDLVVLVWQLLDLNDHQVSDIYYIFIRPHDDAIITEEWQKKTGIKEELLRAAPSFPDAILQFEQTLRNELNSKGKSSSFYLCTDGQCHLRQVLHPVAVKNNVTLPDLFHSFFDLKREVEIAKSPSPHAMEVDGSFSAKSSPLSSPIEVENNLSTMSIDEMMDLFNLKLTTRHEMLGVDHVTKMGLIMKHLVTNDHYSHRLLNPEPVMERLETGPCMNYDIVPDNCVVRARGLPWQASDHDIARFFKGLNIPRGGAALVLNPQGRRNGEALIRFINAEHRDLALLRHMHHMGGRYIEVYRAKGDEFLKVAAGTSLEAVSFLSRDGDAIVRMRGLPFSATQEEIVEFFGNEIPVANGLNGVLLVKYSDGRSTGDAFVLFEDEAMSHLALTKHKQTIGKRYVEIFKSTSAEVQQVLSRHMSTPLIPTVPAPVHFSMYAMPGQGGQPGQPGSLISVANPGQQIVNSGIVRNCVRLRGMPYSATAEDIINFLGDLSYFILPNGVHMVLNQQGRPSGDAFIQLNSAERASQASQDVSKGGCHKKHMGERYVEVFQCSGDEMNMVLMGGTLNRNGIQPPPGMALIQEQLPVPSPAVSAHSANAALAAAAYPQGAAGVPPGLMFPQQGYEYFPPQALLSAAAFPRQAALYPQTAYIPYHHPFHPGSPLAHHPGLQIGNAAALQALAAGQGAVPQQLAALPNSGIQVRMQGVPYNSGVSDILTFFKGYNQPSAGVYNGAAIEGSPRPFEGTPTSGDDKNTLTGNQQRSSEWTCIA